MHNRQFSSFTTVFICHYCIYILLQREASCLPVSSPSLDPIIPSSTDPDVIAQEPCLFRWIGKRLWIFIIVGTLQIILAFLLVVIYFSIRTLTSSLELVETIPSYATAVLVCSIFYTAHVYVNDAVTFIILQVSSQYGPKSLRPLVNMASRIPIWHWVIMALGQYGPGLLGP